MEKEKRTKTITKWLYWFTFAVAVIIVYKTVNNIEEIGAGISTFFKNAAPFLAGILIAYILYIPCTKIEDLYSKTKKIKVISKKARPLSILTVYLIVLILLVILINFIVPPVVKSIIDLVNNFGTYYENTINTINTLPDDSIWKTETATKIIEQIKNIDLAKLVNMEQLTLYAQGAISVASKLFDIFVAIVVSIYILNSRSQILKFFRRLAGSIFNKRMYKNIDKYFNRSNEIFFHFLSSQVLDAIVVGIITSIAMAIIGVKYSVLLGFTIGLFNLIPYVGAIIAVAIATIITLFTGGFSQAIIMLIVVTILQQIDANIINPKIVGNSLEINPVLVILAVTIGGAYYGIIGMFLAVPVITVMKVVLEDFIEYRENKEKKKIE